MRGGGKTQGVRKVGIPRNKHPPFRESTGSDDRIRRATQADIADVEHVVIGVRKCPRNRAR
jgi:hypothetical protein